VDENAETIVVASFENESDAAQAMEDLQAASRKQMVKLKDVEFVHINSDGIVELEEQCDSGSRLRSRIRGFAGVAVGRMRAKAAGLARSGIVLTLTGVSVLADGLANRLRAAGFDDLQLTELAESVQRGGVAVVTVAGANSAEVVNQLMSMVGAKISIPAGTQAISASVQEVDGDAIGGEDIDEMDPIELTQAEKRYLSDEMEKVSRSFALVVPTLEEPFNFYTAVAYLICRVVDNIEDCTQPFDWKERRFQEFHRLLDEPAVAPQILAIWGQEMWPGLTQDETAMMGEITGMLLW
jgi:uncharacterized membrane protein